MVRTLANIFDPISSALDQKIYDGVRPRPQIIAFIKDTFYGAMRDSFIEDPEQYFDLALTGSLTTFQFSETSDCDISVFVHYDAIIEELEVDSPGEVRRELIHIVTTQIDGTIIPGTQHPLQFFVIPPGQTIKNYFAPGMRSGYSLNEKGWLVAPEKKRSHDVSMEMPELYSRCEQMADKMRVLLDDHDLEAARELFAQIHKKRNGDEASGLGDFSEGNLVYKYLLHDGLFDRLKNEAGVRIASAETLPIKEAEQQHTNKTKILYDFERDRILFDREPNEHRASMIIGEYDGHDIWLKGTSKEWINPNYFKRLWLASFPTKPLHKIHIDGKAVTTRPADEMTYTQKLPFLVSHDVHLENPVNYQFVPFTPEELNAYDELSDDDKLKRDYQARGFNSRANKVGASGEITGRELAALAYRYNGCCAYDGMPGADTWDHVLALGNGGSNDADNILPAHHKCNQDLNKWDQKNFPYGTEKSITISPKWREHHVLGSHDAGDCKYPDCDYDFTKEDVDLINLAHGWFGCPQCDRSYHVRTFDHRTSATMADLYKYQLDWKRIELGAQPMVKFKNGAIKVGDPGSGHSSLFDSLGEYPVSMGIRYPDGSEWWNH